jgi:dTDP-4-dehydrorhamnose 3,5-epimerase
MIFTEAPLKGAFFVDMQPIEDERGFFARSFCQREFAAHDLKTGVVQCNVSFNRDKGTLRGMHFQLPPREEAKLVCCTQGKLYDVIIDLRPDSPTFLQWEGVELSKENRRSLYIPEGFAHGYQTLEDNTELFYLMYEIYSPECASGVRWDDPAFDIRWPLSNPIISSKDESYPYYNVSAS